MTTKQLLKPLLLVITPPLLTAALILTLPYWSWQGRIINGNSYEGIVVWHSLLTGYPHGKWFTPSSEIASLENDLPLFLASKKDTLQLLLTELPNYYRQYYSINENGQQKIFVRFIHKSHVGRKTWLHVIFSVMGGGYYFWDIVYDPKTHIFSHLWINADA